MDGCGHEAVRSGSGLLRVHVGRLEVGHRLQSGHGGAGWNVPAIHVATGWEFATQQEMQILEKEYEGESERL